MVLAAACFAAMPASAAVYDCDIDGEHVNPANGSTTAGKTGIMKCVDRDTRKLVREQEYRDGRAVGFLLADEAARADEAVAERGAAVVKAHRAQHAVAVEPVVAPARLVGGIRSVTKPGAGELARDLRMSHSLISQMLRGEKPVSNN